ncbi:CRISPR-associated Cas1 family protein [Thermoflavifilum aggregans]|uniref:CRISPR-associated endonuclease Cas1 n=1 Tax=Thermoflavifilum aggregans TaxID=454188 RepID=A0A2M9CW48_9BACT|nr:type I-B CRISPR-associated endonuclease Cas1b [Thermoflavifilum aggregans]PJJ76152.1 CRISPR-associated Cas1 family protein [Thermoflavifilum aggregans]
MKKSYYLFNPGRMSRKDNTLKFTPVDEEGNEGVPKYIPVESVNNLFCFGSMDANSSLFNFLGKQQILVHFFDYYEHYTGSFFPKDYLLSGKVLIAQAEHYLQPEKRMSLATRFVEAAAFNMLKNLRYYDNRGKETGIQIEKIESYLNQIPFAETVDSLMGIEGNIRMSYYEAFDIIINEFEMGNRTMQPPSNEVNALISFVNMLCYTLCLDMIYHTQLNPTISFLHEPGERRFSLALDIAEVFKPVLVDRLIFSLLNKRQLSDADFDKNLQYCLLKESGKKTVIEAWEAKLNETIKHRSLKRSVSYKHLVKLECYKLVKHIMGVEEYKPFKAWW